MKQTPDLRDLNPYKPGTEGLIDKMIDTHTESPSEEVIASIIRQKTTPIFLEGSSKKSIEMQATAAMAAIIYLVGKYDKESSKWTLASKINSAETLDELQNSLEAIVDRAGNLGDIAQYYEIASEAIEQKKNELSGATDLDS